MKARKCVPGVALVASVSYVCAVLLISLLDYAFFSWDRGLLGSRRGSWEWMWMTPWHAVWLALALVLAVIGCYRDHRTAFIRAFLRALEQQVREQTFALCKIEMLTEICPVVVRPGWFEPQEIRTAAINMLRIRYSTESGPAWVFAEQHQLDLVQGTRPLVRFPEPHACMVGGNKGRLSAGARVVIEHPEPSKVLDNL